MPALLDILPIELIQPILCQLDSRRDLTTAALVCRLFNYAATPLIYRKIGARIKGSRVIAHPSATLLQRPELARYVRHVTETGFAMRRNPRIAQEITAALSLCTNLVSATWMDYDGASEAVFIPFLEILTTLPLKEFIIHAAYGVGDRAWSVLNSMTGLQRLSVFSSISLPVLQGLVAQLGPTLRYLELERLTRGIPPITLISVFSQLPLLRTLRISGVPSAAIPSIMACLPNLVALGVGYPQYQNHDQPHESYHLPSTPLPHLQQLMIQTAFFDVSDADELWNWTCSLIPHEGSLQSFSLESHTEIVIPLSFVTRLIRRHGWSLTQFRSGFAQATPEVLIYLCRNCPNLALLGCPVVSVDMQAIEKAIEPAKNLRIFQCVLWIQVGAADTMPTYYGFRIEEVPFSAVEAKTWMLRPGSKLRTITLGDISYSGKWVRATPERDPVSQIEDGLIFEVVKNRAVYY